VRGVERGGDLRPDPDHDPRRHLELLLLELADGAVERIAAHVIEDDVVVVTLATDVDGRDDVRMANGRRDVGLVVQHVDEGLVAGEVRMDPLQRDGLDEAADPERARDEHLAHPAGGESFDDLVAPQAQRDLAHCLHPAQRTIHASGDGITLRKRGGQAFPDANGANRDL
jgi:hypothetical protein